MLKAAGRLVDHGAIVHSYPFCWRSDTPLIYKAVPSWFVRVEEIKPQVSQRRGADAVQCSAVQCSAVQCSAIQCVACRRRMCVMW